MNATLDRATFVRATAHRGLHNVAKGIVENTAPAFIAAIEHGYAIECDVRPAKHGLPIVFHDETTDRLIAHKGRTSELSENDLQALRYRNSGEHILTLREFLNLVAGRTPILVEIKSDWAISEQGAVPVFLREVAHIAKNYRGPIALMSLDPDLMALAHALAPRLPHGLVAGDFTRNAEFKKYRGAERAHRLTHLLDADRVQPTFIAYEAGAVKNIQAAQHHREINQIPLFAWTVRSSGEWKKLQAFADAPIFENYLP